MESFQLELRDEAFVITHSDETLPEITRRSFELMIAVYNACKKPALWCRTSPWFTLTQDPEVLEYLLNGRPAAPKFQKFQDLQQAGQWDELLVQSFLGSRTFGLKDPPAEDETGSKGTNPVLMPFIDFLNHHFLARGKYKKGVKDLEIEELSEQSALLHQCANSSEMCEKFAAHLGNGGGN